MRTSRDSSLGPSRCTILSLRNPPCRPGYRSTRRRVAITWRSRERTECRTRPERSLLRMCQPVRKSHAQLELGGPCVEQPPDRQIDRSNCIARAGSTRATSILARQESPKWRRESQLRLRNKLLSRLRKSETVETEFASNARFG